MIGKGKEGKRAEGRGEGGDKEGIGTDVSQEIWRNERERSRGRSWHGAQSCPVNFSFLRPGNARGCHAL